MSWFRTTERERKQFVECKGLGPHSTKNGSRWLKVGFHRYVEIADGTVRCERCAQRTRIIRDPYRPSYVPKLTEQEARELGERLQFIQEDYKKYEGRKQVLLEKEENARSSEQTSRQRKL